MAVSMLLPGYLQPLADGRALVEVQDECHTVGDALRALSRRYPGVYDRVVTEAGAVRPHVNVFLEEESIRYLGGLAAKLEDGSKLVILPAVSGG
jgi:molybdopterin synthase sulfur carrier subunit